MFYVYVLEDKRGNFYTGSTHDLKKRLDEHNKGMNTSTKNQVWKVVYYEACLDERDARRREKWLKTTHGGRLLKRRLREYLYERRKLKFHNGV